MMVDPSFSRPTSVSLKSNSFVPSEPIESPKSISRPDGAENKIVEPVMVWVTSISVDSNATLVPALITPVCMVFASVNVMVPELLVALTSP